MFSEDYYRKQAQSGLASPFPFTDHFTVQSGGGGPFYSGKARQQGYGIGGLLAKLGRFIVPIFKPMAKSIGKQVLRSGVRFATDVIDGANPKDAFHRNLKQGAKQLIQKGKSSMISAPHRGHKRKGARRNTVSSKGKRNRKQDVFD